MLYVLANGAQSSSFPVFTLELQTFIQMLPQFLSVVLLAFLFKRYLYKPVKNILQQRADRIEAQMAEATENQASAAALKALYEGKVKDIETERSDILEAARKEASIRVAQILDDAKTDAQITRDRARRDIATEQARVKAEMQQAIVDIATSMAHKLVAATIDQANQDKLFDQAMAELEATAFQA